MASHGYLFEREKDVINTRKSVRELGDSACREADFGYDEKNKDVWGTIQVNMEVLRRELDLAIEEVKKLRSKY